MLGDKINDITNFFREIITSPSKPGNEADMPGTLFLQLSDLELKELLKKYLLSSPSSGDNKVRQRLNMLGEKKLRQTLTPEEQKEWEKFVRVFNNTAFDNDRPRFLLALSCKQENIFTGLDKKNGQSVVLALAKEGNLNNVDFYRAYQLATPFEKKIIDAYLQYSQEDTFALIKEEISTDLKMMPFLIKLYDAPINRKYVPEIERFVLSETPPEILHSVAFIKQILLLTEDTHTDFSEAFPIKIISDKVTTPWDGTFYLTKEEMEMLCQEISQETIDGNYYRDCPLGFILPESSGRKLLSRFQQVFSTETLQLIKKAYPSYIFQLTTSLSQSKDVKNVTIEDIHRELSNYLKSSKQNNFDIDGLARVLAIRTDLHAQITPEEANTIFWHLIPIIKLNRLSADIFTKHLLVFLLNKVIQTNDHQKPNSGLSHQDFNMNYLYLRSLIQPDKQADIICPDARLENLYKTCQSLNPPITNFDCYKTIEILEQVVKYRTQPLDPAKPIVVFTLPTDDHNYAFRENNLDELFNREPKIQVVCVEASEDIQVPQAIKNAYYCNRPPEENITRPIDLLLINAHGSRNGIRLGGGWSEETRIGYEDTEEFRDIHKYLKEDIDVGFNCCSVDKKKDDDNIDDFLSRRVLSDDELAKRGMVYSEQYENIIAWWKDLLPEGARIHAPNRAVSVGELIFSEENDNRIIIGIDFSNPRVNILY